MVLGDFTYRKTKTDEMIKMKIGTIVESFDLKDQSSLGKWLTQVLPNYGPYSCYAIPLFLPSDAEARQYIRTFGREIDLISGKNCLVIGLTKNKLQNFDSDYWGHVVDGRIHEEYGVVISDLFGIDFTQFPCIVIFQDIRSSNHIVITLKGMTVEEISKVMREIFSIIRKAISKNKSPLAALRAHRKKEKFCRNGQTIISELRSLAGKTFEAVVEAWMKNSKLI